MVKHIVFFKLEDNSKEHCEKVKERLLTMRENIKILKNIEVGINFAEEERAYDLALLTDFDSEENLTIYVKHPFHQDIITYMKSVAVSSKVVDYKY